MGGFILALVLWAVGIFILYSIIKAAINHSEMIKQMRKMNRKMDEMSKLLVQLHAQNGGGVSGSESGASAIERYEPCPACGDAAPIGATACPSCGITLNAEEPPVRRNNDE